MEGGNGEPVFRRAAGCVRNWQTVQIQTGRVGFEVSSGIIKQADLRAKGQFRRERLGQVVNHTPGFALTPIIATGEVVVGIVQTRETRRSVRRSQSRIA